MPAAELEQCLEELLGIDADPAHMLVVMPQHDPDAHEFAPLVRFQGEATRESRELASGPAGCLCAPTRRLGCERP